MSTRRTKTAKPLPRYLGLNNAVILKSVINNRLEATEKLVKRTPYIIDFTKKLQAAGLNFWAIGSRAMEAFFKNHKPEYLKTKDAIGKAALASQGWDFQVATSNPLEQKQTTVVVYDQIQALAKELSKTSIKIFTVKTTGWTKHWFTSPSFDSPPRQELFNGYGVQLFMNRFPLINIVILDVGGMNIPVFKKTYLDSVSTPYPHLNIYGIMTYLEFIKSKRKEKKLNIDAFRKNVVKEYFQKELGKSPSQTFETVFKLYVQVWKSSKLFSVDFAQSMMYDSLIENPVYKGFLDGVDAKIIEYLRPSLNALIKSISCQLHSDECIFVAGGDAIRRLTDVDKKTSDIDTKVFCPHFQITSGGKELLKTILKSCSDSIALFESTKSVMLPEALEHKGVKCVFNYKGSQFRLRKIASHDNFPIVLVSIDYQMKIIASPTGAQRERSSLAKGHYFEHILPVLDVAIFFGKSKKDKYITVTKTGIPVASKVYLARDLKKTWKDFDKVSQRIFAGKKDKNLRRYQAIIKDRIPSPPSAALLDKLNKVDTSFYKTLTGLFAKPDIYYTAFDTLSKQRDQEDQVKAFVPYTLGPFLGAKRGAYESYVKAVFQRYRNAK